MFNKDSPNSLPDSYSRGSLHEDSSMDPLSVASGTAGLLSLGIGICKGLLEYYESRKDADGQLSQMYSSIDALRKTLILLKSSIENQRFNHSIVLRVEESIASTESGIEKLQKKLDKIKIIPKQDGWKDAGKAHLHRALFPFKESTLVKLRELGNELQDNLHLALDVLQM